MKNTRKTGFDPSENARQIIFHDSGDEYLRNVPQVRNIVPWFLSGEVLEYYREASWHLNAKESIFAYNAIMEIRKHKKSEKKLMTLSKDDSFFYLEFAPTNRGLESALQTFNNLYIHTQREYVLSDGTIVIPNVQVLVADSIKQTFNNSEIMLLSQEYKILICHDYGMAPIERYNFLNYEK